MDNLWCRRSQCNGYGETVMSARLSSLQETRPVRNVDTFVVRIVPGIRKSPFYHRSARTPVLTPCRAKKKKYPDGYPGDAFSTNTSVPVKYSCSKCSKVFPAVPHPDSEEGKAHAASEPPQKCVRCGHERCPECPRAAPQKIEPAPDPDVLKSVQAKLAALNVSSTS